MRLTKKLVAVACLTAAVPALVSANNGDQMVGYSGLSNAMSGAVVATPQDVSTVLSNPAGLAFLHMGNEHTRFDMNLAVLNPNRTMNGIESDSSAFVMASGGFAFQSESYGDRVTIGVGAYPISGGGVDFPVGSLKLGTGTYSVVASRMSLRIGPGFSYKVNPDLAIGANLNLAVNQMSVKTFNAMTSTSTTYPQDVAYGYSYVFGTVYQLNNNMRLGAAYTSRSYIEDLEWNMDNGKWNLSFQDPQTAAVGLSFQPNDRLQLEADVKWIDFSDVRTSATLIGPTSSQVLAYGWEDQTVYALGMKYRSSNSITLMAGYNYGKSPLDASDVNNNVGVTAIVEHHLSAGISMRASKYSTLNFSVIHGFENELTATSNLPGQTTPTNVSFETNLLTLQFTYQH